MQTTAQGTNPAVSASGEIDSLLIEKFTGRVHESMTTGENLMAYFDVQEVTGTNKVTEKYIGVTALEVLAPGSPPKGNVTEFDNNSLTVDTVIIARNTVQLLNDVQKDIDGLSSKLSKNQAGQHKKLEDKMLTQQLVFSAISNTAAKQSKPRVAGHGYSQLVTAKTEDLEDNPNLVLAALESLIEAMVAPVDSEADGAELNELAIMMPWKYFNILRDAERICNSEYSISESNGAPIQGFTLKSYNIPVIPTNRIAKAAEKSLLSNPQNGNRYDTLATMLGVVAIVFAPEALLVGRSISLIGDIWQDKGTKAYIIDSWQAEGAICSRWDRVGLVQATTDPTPASLVSRAKRKAIFTRAVA